MKTAIHPQYHEQAVIKCMNCGNEWKLGNTQEKVEIEICSKCHPFFTGKKVLIDTEGRVDKFKKKLDSATGRKKKTRKRTTLEDRVNEELAAQFEKAKDKDEKAKKPAKKEEVVEETPAPEAAPEPEVQETPEVVEETAPETTEAPAAETPAEETAE